ncbi:MAG TPA: hypothetical protein DCY25_13295 [Bacteroidales bacterium]|nr:hypothetical protein [Bacteroidales bacterium]
MFPEGTRTLDGKINPFFRGFIYLMRTGNSDILPITLNGFYNLKPKNRLFIDFGSKLFKEAAAEIELHRGNNVRTVLLSSSVCQICREI